MVQKPLLAKCLMGAFLVGSMALSTGSEAQVNSYVFSQSNGAFTPLSGPTLIDSAYYISTSVNNSMDTKGWNIQLPFSFTFNGVAYDSLYANSNGGVTFGTTVSTASSLLSGTTAYAGALAIMNRDLWALTVVSGSSTSGSNIITNVSSFLGLEVGAALYASSSIPNGSVVTSYDAGAGTITMSNAASTTTSSLTFRYGAGKVFTKTLGSAPNRTFVVEWKNFSDYNTSANNSGFNFQVQLDETSNIIRYVYGPYTVGVATARTNQVGLRGSVNTDYNNRTSSTDWAATTVGASNSASVTRTNTIFPATGLTFTWTPATCLPPVNVSATNVTTTTADLAWAPQGTPPANGYDYYLNLSATAPSSSATPTGSTGAGDTTEGVINLSPASTYYLWVRSKCSGSDVSSWTLSYTFNTLCNPQATPFTASFTSGTLPNCWSNTNSTSTNANTYWKFTGTPDYGVASNGRTAGTYVWVDASSTYTGVHDVTLTTGDISLAGLAAPAIQFDWYKNHQYAATYDNNKLTVQVYDGVGWNSIFSDTSNSAAWRTVTVPLAASYNGTTVRLRFVVDKDVNGNGYFYDDLALDEFKVIDGTPLAIKMDKLAGMVKNTVATLSWNTYSEENNRGFEVQRSKDAIHFEPFAFVASKAVNGNSNEKIAYSATDNIWEKTYYRLKQSDMDGKATFSNIIQLSPGSANSHLLSLSPNPASDIINVSAPGIEGGILSIFDFSGKEVLRSEVNAVQANVNISSMASGNYFIRVINNANSYSAKFIKK